MPHEALSLKTNFILFYSIVLGTARIPENNEETRYANKIVRSCQKTRVYINWFI